MLIDKLNEEELEFAESLYDPQCLAECLFSDGDNLSSFDANKYLEIRTGQLPLLSYEYLVDDTKEPTKKAGMRLKEGAGNIYCYGGRNFGKCEYEENKCLLANGEYKKFKDLVGTSQEVISLDTETYKLKTTTANFFDNGIKECLKITLCSGKNITVTKNHPLLSSCDWVEAENIKVGDLVATPNRYNIEGSEYYSKEDFRKTAFLDELPEKVFSLDKKPITFLLNCIISNFGRVNAQTKEQELTCSTEIKAEQIVSLFLRFGIQTSIYKENSVWKVVVKNKIDSGTEICYETVISIENIGEKPTVSVSIDDDCHNYISNNIVSHNTFIVEKLDIATSLILNDGWEMCLTSYDDAHIQGVLDPISDAIENHPFLNIFKSNIRKKPNYKIRSKTGAFVEGINMALSSRAPGNGFFQKHFKKIWKEEGSQETIEVYNKRVDSRHESGCVERESGMTDFTRYSPAGKVFYDESRINQLVNLPQYINPNWGEREKENSLKKYDGEEAIAYRIFVKAEVVEDKVSVFDMERVKKCYNRQKHIVTFEITKDTFKSFKDIIVVERPVNAKKIWLGADIGRSGKTEIIIFSEVDKKYNYLYNISLYNLTDREQDDIFWHLSEVLDVEQLALDCGEGTGASIYGFLERKGLKNRLFWYDGSRKIPVDFEKDETGKILMEKGQPTFRELCMAEWSVKNLQSLFYENRFSIPIDFKLDKQLNSVVSVKSGNRVIYQCICEDDHLFDAFRVFSVCQWSNEFSETQPKKNNNWGIGVNSN